MGEELDHREDRRYTRRRTGSAVNQPTRIEWGWLLAGGVLALCLVARDWSFRGLGVTELLLLPVLAVLCLWPGLRWYQRGMKWIPLGESFAGMHLIFYVLPCLDGRPDWLGFSPELRAKTLLAVGAFLLVFVLIYEWLLRPTPGSVKHSTFFLRESNPSAFWLLFCLWLGWSVMVQTGWLPGLGSLLNVFRSVITAAASIAIVNLFFRLGRGWLSGGDVALVLGGLLIGLVISFASGFLITGGLLMMAALMAYTLGRKRLPVLALLSCALVLAFLNLGKVEYRDTYWAEGKNYSEQHVGLVEGFSTWFQASWHGLTHGTTGGDNASSRELLYRASLVQVLATAMQTVPGQKSFLNGETYLMLPELLTPRIFWPEKPRGTIPTETMGIYIGIQSEQNADYTGVSVGPLAEGWLNFGWIGVVGAGAFFAVFFGLPARLSRDLTPIQVGWLLASVFLVYSTDTSHSIPELIASLVQALLMGALVMFFVSSEKVVAAPSRRRQRQRQLLRTQNEAVANGHAQDGNASLVEPAQQHVHQNASGN
ncbi:MAG TPA: hypothetical protein VFY06_01275 [Verrucomicrobiae bacterium]|nr:hypothetical protein [Verrucomicrobiae bacterium]